MPEVITPTTRLRNESSLVELNRQPDALMQRTNEFYLGYKYRQPGDVDSPIWLIRRIAIDPRTGITTFMYPDGNDDQYIQKFSECETLNYEFAK
jgi:hypothetical protein